jgi:hypothetical protein
MIKMYIEAIDSYGKGSHHEFDTVAQARAKFKYHFGDKFESGDTLFHGMGLSLARLMLHQRLLNKSPIDGLTCNKTKESGGISPLSFEHEKRINLIHCLITFLLLYLSHA